MLCPDHNIKVEDCCCPVAQDLIELSGKQISDNIEQAEADEIALKLYEKCKKGQRNLFDLS